MLPSHTLPHFHLCFVLRVPPLKQAFVLIFIDEHSSISYVKDVMVIKWVLKATPYVKRGPPHLPCCVCNKRPTLVQRGEEASCRQVCSSCSYLWANTGCLFSLGKYRLLYKCTHRSDCTSDANCPQNDTSDWFCLSLYFQADGFLSLLEDVLTVDVVNNRIISSSTLLLKTSRTVYVNFHHHTSHLLESKEWLDSKKQKIVSVW